MLFLMACSGSEDDESAHSGRDGDTDSPGMMSGRDMMGDDGMMGEGMMGEGMMGEGMMGEGMMPDSMPRWMMSEGMMDEGMMQDMRVIHSLLTQHQQIEREVEDIPGGVRTTTTSPDPEIAEVIRIHVRQMKERMEEGRPIRRMDPLFRELFDHHEEIDMAYEDIPGGVRVMETSQNPEVVSLIRQHARAFVNEAVEHGMQRAMQPTPLPEGYRR